MYSRQEATQLKQEFWTLFGQYLHPIKSAEGEKINWINYKTGQQHIKFHMDADNKMATIGIVLQHSDNDIRALFFEQLTELKNMLYATTNENWIWQQDAINNNGQKQSIVFARLDNISVFNKEDWPKAIQFFKPRLIALDAFWCNAKYAFEALS